MADQKIRSFLAIQPDHSAIEEVGDFLTKIQPQHPQFRFIPPKNWHLTLHFLGSISSQRLDTLKSILLECVSKIKPFSISFKGLGGFPNEKKSSILWIGIHGETDQLMHLEEVLKFVLSDSSFSVENRPYHPHITIARSRKPAICPISDAEKNIKFNRQWQVQKITLFQSELSSGGAHHTPLHDFHLTSSILGC